MGRSQSYLAGSPMQSSGRTVGTASLCCSFPVLQTLAGTSEADSGARREQLDADRWPQRGREEYGKLRVKEEQEEEKVEEMSDVCFCLFVDLQLLKCVLRDLQEEEEVQTNLLQVHLNGETCFLYDYYCHHYYCCSLSS